MHRGPRRSRSFKRDDGFSYKLRRLRHHRHPFSVDCKKIHWNFSISPWANCQRYTYGYIAGKPKRACPTLCTSVRRYNLRRKQVMLEDLPALWKRKNGLAEAGDIWFLLTINSTVGRLVNIQTNQFMLKEYRNIGNKRSRQHLLRAPNTIQIINRWLEQSSCRMSVIVLLRYYLEMVLLC